MKKIIVTATAGVAMLIMSGSARATELIYGFNDSTLSGFGTTYDQDGTATISESTSTGVTEGAGALHIAVGATGGGYDQVDLVTNTVPADLIAPATNSLTLSATANYGNAVYITVAPAFYLDGTTDGTTAFGTKLLFPSKTLAYDTGTTPLSEVYSLLIRDPYATAHAAGNGVTGPAATPADGDSTTTLYTPGHIVSQLLAALQASNSSATASIGSFGLEETTNTDGTDANGNPLTDFGDDLYIDNVTVPVTVPEPASIGVLALSGIAMFRRRTRTAL